MLTLTEALKTGRLRDFIAQEETRGVKPVAGNELDTAIKRVASTPQQSKRRTSHLSSGDGSTGK
jgi:hypothetical protein